MIRKSLFLGFAFCTVIACLSFNYIKPTDLHKSPDEIGKLVIADLLSRPEFMMYKTPDVFAVHYAEACAGYGAIKLAGLIQDKSMMQALTARYDRVIDEKIPNSSNHVDVNVYGILPLELFLQNKQQNISNKGYH